MIKIFFDKSELQEQKNCPVCGGDGILKYSNINDNIYGVSGDWNYLQCNNCASLYLKTIPRMDNISKAYLNYYTHNNEVNKISEKCNKNNIINSIKLVFNKINKIIIKKTKKLAFLIPNINDAIKYYDRYINQITTNDAIILEIGCGDGSFIKKIKEKRNKVYGIDFDLKVVEECVKSNLNVTNDTLDQFVSKFGKIDYLIVHHVIEHVYDPHLFLIKCYDSLNKGGCIWIETPNCNSNSSYIFKSYWRGLEPPRHLQVFNSESLLWLLRKVGFNIIILPNRPSPLKFMMNESLKIAKKSNIGTLGKYIIILKVVQTMLDFRKWRNQEFITIIAKKN